MRGFPFSPILLQTLKVADFGSTRRVTEFLKGKAEELCPLWYRPPEVIVGFPFMSYSLDLWCLGNILYELATGTVLFQGNNLNEQLKMYIEMFGVLPKKMVRNADTYFYNGDPTKVGRDIAFLCVVADPLFRSLSRCSWTLSLAGPSRRLWM